MTYISLLLICILSVEIFIKSNFLSNLDLIFNLIKQVVHVVISRNISDHWKEKTLPVYSLRIMKYSLKIFIILSLLLFLFLMVGFFFNDFLSLVLSLSGVIMSLFFSIGYFYLRKSFIK